ncbi:MAG TPA: hypothetical protein VGV13_04895 [Methylomirabilota bacterium]|jgi:hypothetical protein|nr:hypothetical protein [Methylomirabilota bacterium]
MKRLLVLPSLVVLTLAAGCALKAGHLFPSPAPASIMIGTTDRAFLERTFGAPYQVGIDSGDPTWRWFYLERRAGGELTKDLTVRFNPNGTVKSYSFTSNFPEDMSRLR